MEALYTECQQCLELLAAIELVKHHARRTNAKLRGYPSGAEGEAPYLYAESLAVECDSCHGLRMVLTKNGNMLLSILKAMKNAER